MRFALDKVAMGQVFLQVLKGFPVSTIPPMLHIRLHLLYMLLFEEDERV